ncbi:MAG: DUF4469 domain-containing protein [Treponema sp.]|nr:DUF4469 domain-containing protein [Treponema sp.]
MNLATLCNEPVVSKTGRLAIALYPSNLHSGGNACYARVISRCRLTQEDIVNDILVNGTELSKETLMAAWKLINSAIICRLADGISVDTGLGQLRPAVTGMFAGECDEFDRERHAITVQYRPGGLLKEVMASLTPVIAQGNHIVPEITAAEDKTLSPGEDGILTPGGFFSIQGKNIMVLDKEGEDGDGTTAGLWFDNVDEPEKSVRLPSSQICHNSRNLLEGIIPRLAPGRYRLRVVTHFCGSKRRKTAQEHSLGKPFLVRSA